MQKMYGGLHDYKSTACRMILLAQCRIARFLRRAHFRCRYFCPHKTKQLCQHKQLHNALDVIYQGEPWFGESLQTKLKNVSKRAHSNNQWTTKHSIAEILSHMEYWRKRFALEVQGQIFTGFSETENWPEAGDLKKRGWKNYKHLLRKHTMSWLVCSKNQTINNSAQQSLSTTWMAWWIMMCIIWGKSGIVKSLVNK